MSRLRRRPRIVRTVRPIRVLVASRDKRFLRVTAFLLRRAGFGVEISTRPDAMVGLVADQMPNVVVIDPASAAEVRDIVAALTTSNPSVSIVVLTDDTAAVPSTARIRSIERWCPFDDLAREIESTCALQALPPRAALD